MRFSLDPGDVVGDGCWETVKRVLVVASTLWVGAMAAIVAFYAAQAIGLVMSGAWSDLTDLILEAGEAILWGLLLAPIYFLFTFWGLVMIPLMGLVMFHMFRSDKDVTWVWFATSLIVSVVGLMGLLGFGADSSLQVLAWVLLCFLMISLAVGCWLLMGWRRNAQARHLMEVHAENEQRRAELREKFGTTSFGQDHKPTWSDRSL